MAQVALFERTPTGVMVKHLDVRSGKSVEDVADVVKAEMVGRAMIEWWANGDLAPRGGTNWWGINYHPDGPYRPARVYDLRGLLRDALTKWGRISTLAGALSLTPDRRPVVAHDAPTKAEAIGRDLLAWWAAADESRWLRVPGPRGLTAEIDLRISVNQAMHGYEVERERLRARAAGQRPKGP